MPAVKPSDMEMQVLSVLWDQGPLTVREVQERLPDEKDRAYTTVLSIMQVMEKKGLLTHSVEGRANVYKPAVTRKQVMRPFMRSLLRNVFGGSPARAMQQLLDEGSVDAEELAAIRKLIDDHDNGARGKKR
jgi:BlaI family transcriptional regulator, penicillinase repressor